MMYFILGCLACGVALVVALFKHGTNGLEWHNLAAVILGVIVALGLGVSAVGGSILAYSWTASECKAAIINREYGTAYTREEVFFASDVIDTIREIDRFRYEVNGNLIQKNTP